MTLYFFINIQTMRVTLEKPALQNFYYCPEQPFPIPPRITLGCHHGNHWCKPTKSWHKLKAWKVWLELKLTAKVPFKCSGFWQESLLRRDVDIWFNTSCPCWYSKRLCLAYSRLEEFTDNPQMTTPLSVSRLRYLIIRVRDVFHQSSRTNLCSGFNDRHLILTHVT